MKRFSWVLVVLVPLLLILVPFSQAAPPQQVFITPTVDTFIPLVMQPLPTNTPTATAVVTRVPGPQGVSVRSSRTVRLTSDTLYIVGEVENNTTATVYDIRVTARYYDAAGTLIASDTTFAYLFRTDTGQRSPFRISASFAPTTITRTDLKVTYQTEPSTIEYHHPEVLSQNVRNASSGWEISGRLRNTTPYRLIGIGAVVTFYDAAGNVLNVGLRFGSLLSLSAGDAVDYRIPTVIQEPYASFIVQAEGYKDE